MIEYLGNTEKVVYPKDVLDFDIKNLILVVYSLQEDSEIAQSTPGKPFHLTT